MTVFPEAPLTIHRDQPAGDCRIEDGGVWGRDGVWLSADGGTLVTTESSGSSLGLVFHDTRSCAKFGEVDVSDATWRLAGRSLVVKQVAAPHARKSRHRRRWPLYHGAYPMMCRGSIGQAQRQGDKSVNAVWSRADRDKVAYDEFGLQVCKA